MPRKKVAEKVAPCASKGPQVSFEDLALLKPLLRSLPRARGDEWVDAFGECGKPYAVCLSCGAKDQRIMLRKHRKNCAYQAHWRALEHLRALLGEQ
jgi:hypothetical protein